MRGHFAAHRISTVRSSSATPRDEIRRVLEPYLPKGTKLPSIKRLELYYIRNVAGHPKGAVSKYDPEFAYIMDIGYPQFPILNLPYEVVGLGDPYFPNFNKAEVYSGTGWSALEILYPDALKEILIGVQKGVSEGDVRKALAPYVDSLQNVGSFYLATVKAFHERETASRIQTEVDIVRYAETNPVVRGNGDPWYVDQVL